MTDDNNNIQLTSIEQRLSETETDVSELKESVARLDTKLISVDDNVHIVINSLATIREQLIQSTKTNWGTIAGGVLVVVTVFGGIFSYVISGISSDLTRLQSNSESAFTFQLDTRDKMYENEIASLRRELEKKE